MLSSRSHTHALNALIPILQDANYYAQNGAYNLSTSLLPQVQQAIDEVDTLLTPASPERLKQLLLRLMLHFTGFGSQIRPPLLCDYQQALHTYPEDLLCAAYLHILKNHRGPHFPSIADFVIFMELEYLHRRAMKQKLLILLEKNSLTEA